MSRFIKSYTDITFRKNPFIKIGFYSDLFIQQWAFHIIPSIHLYFESRHPFNHGKIWNTGISSLYLSLQWGKWLYTIGIYKKL